MDLGKVVGGVCPAGGTHPANRRMDLGKVVGGVCPADGTHPAKRRMDLGKVNKWTRAKLAARLRQGGRLCSCKEDSRVFSCLSARSRSFLGGLALGSWESWSGATSRLALGSGQGTKKERVQSLLQSHPLILKWRLPTLPLSQYHRHNWA